MSSIILFDGECNFCDHSVQFIIKRDLKAAFKFAALQSDIGKELTKKYGVLENIDSIILVEDTKCYYKSSAALRIAKRLNGGWKLLYCLVLLPKPLRDYFYSYFAKNRYKWFGRKEICMIPTPDIRKRFL